MNVNLQKTFDFQCGVVYQNQFIINNYSATFDIVTQSEVLIENNIAYERIKYWINHVVNNSIVISRHSEKLQQWIDTDSRLLAFPEEPVDQLMGIMLSIKLNCICQGRLLVSHVSISSDQGDNMIYLHEYDDPVGPMAEDSWWNDSSPAWQVSSNKSRGRKVIALDRTMDWKDLDLGWDEPEKNNTVVIANFPKNHAEK